MSDADEESNRPTPTRPRDPKVGEMLFPPSSQPYSSFIMDLDFADLGATWQFDPIPTSPFLIPTSDQPFSPPVWAMPPEFSDDKSAAAAAANAAASAIGAVFSGACGVSSDGRAMPCNLETDGEQKDDNEEDEDHDCKKKLLLSFLGSARLSSDVSSVIKERMTQALRYFKESTDQHQILAQVWAPIKRGNRSMLTTLGQPFILTPHSNGLHQYRTVSLNYMFSIEGRGDGLPGRVFRHKLPEWTPDVQYYTSKEYSRINHAKDYDVHGTLALPVFEPVGSTCVGVLELIMTSQKINYAPEVEKVCKALETVNLKSSEILDQPDIQICNLGRQNALADILQVVTEICETYKLPLVQTWTPCIGRSILAYGGGLKKSCSSFDGSCMNQVCMSTSDVASYVVDARMCYFHEACSEHHLRKGQGVPGRAFASKGSCFCVDIRQFSKLDYPLVHYAKLFELRSSFAICLRSKHTGEDDYIVELFLPPCLTDHAEQLKILDSILATAKQHFHNLVVASGRSLEEERQCMETVDGSTTVDIDFSNGEPLPFSHLARSLPMMEELNGVITSKDDFSGQKSAEKKEDGVEEKRSAVCNGGSSHVASSSKVKEVKKGERKRGKAEKQISLEVLQQYFAGSLKDAAKSLGVCPTTMKRICRQHGISRWPSRKINKVNRSLTKLKRVIESVHGPDGSFGLSSIPPSSLPAGVGSASWPPGLSGSSQQQQQQQQQSPPICTTSTLPGEKIELSTSKTLMDYHGSDERENGDDDLNVKLNGSSGGLHGSPRTGGSGSNETSSRGTSTSHGSCQGSPGNDQVGNNAMGLVAVGNGSLNGLADPFHHQDSLLLGPQAESFGGMLLAEDAGSSKDLRNLCPSVADANVDEAMQEPSWLSPLSHKTAGLCPESGGLVAPRFSARQEMRTVTIKATFREDIIRFRFALNSGIVELREEVAKRLKLEVGTFEIKYLDDDSEWVLIACDADLQECLDLITSSGNNVIRLSIHDILGNLGSSCESSGE